MCGQQGGTPIFSLVDILKSPGSTGIPSAKDINKVETISAIERDVILSKKESRLEVCAVSTRDL